MHTGSSIGGSVARAGFTLPEMMIAVTIMVMGLGAAALTMSFATKTTATARNQMRALQFARAELEDKRETAFGDPELAVGTRTVSNSLYTGYYVVSNAGSNLKSVTMNIYWSNVVTRSRSQVTLSTIFSDAIH